MQHTPPGEPAQAPMKVIRPKKNKRAHDPPVRVPFAIVATRKGIEEQHAFIGLPVIDAASFTYAARAGVSEMGRIEGLLRAIRKMMCDDDGTPANWEPEPYQPATEAPAEDTADTTPQPPHLYHQPAFDEMRLPDEHEDDDEDEKPQLYVAPLGGDPIDADAVAEAEKFENGSSLRRWLFLMESDEEIVIEFEVLQGVFEYLAGRAANRPTARSS